MSVATVPEIVHVLVSLLDLFNFLNVFRFLFWRLRMDLGGYLGRLRLSGWLLYLLLIFSFFAFDGVSLLLHLLDRL